MTQKTIKWLHSTLLIPLQLKIKCSTLLICLQVKIKYGLYYRVNLITNNIRISCLSSRSGVPIPPERYFNTHLHVVEMHPVVFISCQICCLEIKILQIVLWVYTNTLKPGHNIHHSPIAIYCLMSAILEYWYHNRKIQYAINLCKKCLQLYSPGLTIIIYQKYQHWWIECGFCPSHFKHIIAEWQPSLKIAATVWTCNVPLIF